MPEVVHLLAFFPAKQHQPTIEVVGQHGDLKMIAVHLPLMRGISRQTGVVIGFLNQILSSGPLIVEPHQGRDGAPHVGDKNPIGILGVSNNWYCSSDPSAGAFFLS